MKKTLLITFCFNLLLNFGFAQDIYTECKIFQNSGDTTNVVMSNLFSSKEISVKYQNSRKAHTILPSQIKGFETNENIYLSKLLQITDYVTDETFKNTSIGLIQSPILLEKRHDSKPYFDSVFVHSLIKGKINLYELSTDENNKLFYAEKDGIIHALPPIYFDVKKDTARGYALLYMNGIYTQIPRLSGTYTEKKDYIDTLIPFRFINSYIYEWDINESNLSKKVSMKLNISGIFIRNKQNIFVQSYDVFYFIVKGKNLSK